MNYNTNYLLNYYLKFSQLLEELKLKKKIVYLQKKNIFIKFSHETLQCIKGKPIIVYMP